MTKRQYLATIFLALALNEKRKAAKLLWPWMVQNAWTERIWEAMEKYPYLAILGHGSASKSFTAAAWSLLEWWSDMQTTAVIVTSDTIASMSRRIWSDLKLLHSKTHVPMPGILIDSRRILKHTAIDEKNAIAGIAAESDDAQSKIQGIHTQRIRVIIDEADNRLSGSIWSAISNLATSGDLRVVALANPADRSGHFGRHCEPKDGWASVNPEVDFEWEGKLGWHVLRLDGLRSPNIIAKEDKFPFLLTNGGLESIREKDGEKSPQWWTYVRGWFPPEGAASVIFSQEVLNRIPKQPFIWHSNKIPIAACDPAFEGGDTCVLVLGHTGRLAADPKKTIISAERFIRIQRKDTKVPITIDFSSQVVALCKKHGVKPQNFTIDSTGNALGMSDYIKHTWSGETMAVAFGGSPTNLKITLEDSARAVDRYDRFVSELWYATREWMKLGLIHVQSPIPPELLFQLESRTYDMKGQKIRIETKPEMKERGLDSPDFGDALCLLVHLVRARSEIAFTPAQLAQSEQDRKDPLRKFRQKSFSFAQHYGLKDSGQDDRKYLRETAKY